MSAYSVTVRTIDRWLGSIGALSVARLRGVSANPARTSCQGLWLRTQPGPLMDGDSLVTRVLMVRVTTKPIRPGLLEGLHPVEQVSGSLSSSFEQVTDPRQVFAWFEFSVVAGDGLSNVSAMCPRWEVGR